MFGEEEVEEEGEEGTWDTEGDIWSLSDVWSVDDKMDSASSMVRRGAME